MKQFNPFPPANCQRGAPMGRYGGNPANLQGIKRLHARHQGGGDGYDRGGAYWGSPCDVWAVWARLDGDVVVAYVRAGSRDAAIKQVREGAKNESETNQTRASQTRRQMRILGSNPWKFNRCTLGSLKP